MRSVYESRSMLSIPETLEFEPSLFFIFIEAILKSLPLKTFVPCIFKHLLLEDGVWRINMLLGDFISFCVVVSSIEGTPEGDGAKEWTVHSILLNFNYDHDQINCKLCDTSLVASWMSGPKNRSSYNRGNVLWTVLIIFANLSDGLRSDRIVMEQAHISSSMPKIWVMLWSNISHLRAAKPPIDTWSSCPADVTIESTEAGLTSTLLSDNKAALVSILDKEVTLSNHKPTVKTSVFDQEMRQSWYFAIDVFLNPSLAEFSKREESKSKKIGSFCHIFPMEISSTDELIFFNTFLFVVYQRVISSTVHFLFNCFDSAFEIFNNSSQSLRVVK